MKIGRIVIAGIVVTVFSAVVGAITCGGIFNWVYHVEPADVWKPMEGPPGVAFYIGSLALNIILAFVYALLRKGIPGRTKVIKGLVFGLCVWAVGVLPGMFATHVFMTVAAAFVAYTTIMGLILNPLKGIIIAAIYGE